MLGMLKSTCSPLDHPLHLAITSHPARGPVSNMIARTALQRQAQRVVRQSWHQSTRGYASASAGASLQYQQGDASGLKFASRDNSGAVSTVALVSKAGTRYQTLPGLAEALDRYAFRVRAGTEFAGSPIYNSNERGCTDNRTTIDFADTARVGTVGLGAPRIPHPREPDRGSQVPAR